MPSLKELATRPERLSGGHRLCAGCGASIAVRQIARCTQDPIVVGCSTGCLEVATTIFPYTAWRVPYIHSAFENVAPTISGVETAYRALKKRSRLPVDKPIKFIAFGGDGGLYDIGFGSLSGVLERRHNMLTVCYNNGAYMNTGIQRSSATPQCADTTTAPVGAVSSGKTVPPKDLTAVVAAHDVPYAAQASIGNWRDLVAKAEKALATEGPTFLNVLAPCPRGWRHKPDETVDIAKGAVECRIWPLFEVEDGVWRVTYKPKQKMPVADWLARQGRFRHLARPENKHLVDEIQEYVDRKWEQLLRLEASAGIEVEA